MLVYKEIKVEAGAVAKPVILATWEVDIRRIIVVGQLSQKS
jgi:hypothetical protein